MIKEIRILAVDDDRSALESLKMILKIKDYEVDSFGTGQEAVNAVEKDKYDVAFIDQNLMEGPPPYNGKYGGIEVLKKIKEIDPAVEVVIITAYGHLYDMRLGAISAGAMEYLDKPYIMEKIYELVDRALRRRSEKGAKKKPSQPPPSVH